MVYQPGRILKNERTEQIYTGCSLVNRILIKNFRLLSWNSSLEIKGFSVPFLTDGQIIG